MEELTLLTVETVHPQIFTVRQFASDTSIIPSLVVRTARKSAKRRVNQGLQVSLRVVNTTRCTG